MIRIILKTIIHKEELNLHEEHYRTLDLDVPELEKLLLSGGTGNGGYERNSLIGVEVL